MNNEGVLDYSRWPAIGMEVHWGRKSESTLRCSVRIMTKLMTKMTGQGFSRLFYRPTLLNYYSLHPLRLTRSSVKRHLPSCEFRTSRGVKSQWLNVLELPLLLNDRGKPSSILYHKLQY